MFTDTQPDTQTTARLVYYKLTFELKMISESRNHRMTDRLKTVYPPKITFCGGMNRIVRVSSKIVHLLEVSTHPSAAVSMVEFHELS